MKGRTIALGFLVAAAACGGSRGLGPGNGGSGGATAGHGGANGGTGGGGISITFNQAINRNVDVVFVIDDSAGGLPLQPKVQSAISAYFDVLKSLPGGLPNIHVGVVSSNMGAGTNTSISNCPPGGDQGIFQTKPLGGAPCTRASLNPGQNFISNVNGLTNYTGDIADMFGCISLLGESGCGFEHDFESVLRALGADGAPGPAENANFLRTDAYLQVVLVTNEDDCSAPPNSDLFDSSSMFVSDPLGPLQHYRCNEFGHLCGGKPPPRQPVGEVDLSNTCVSTEDGRLIRVADFVKALKGVKTDPSKVFVSAIAGPPNPYKVTVGPPEIKTDPNQWPYVEHSCTQNEPDGSQSYADPSVRIAQMITAFGANGAFEDFCQADFTQSLQRIASQIGKAMGPPCFPANVDPAKCHAVDMVYAANGVPTSTPLPRCMNAMDAGPCWDIGPSTAACTQPFVARRPAPLTAAGSTTLTCTP
jgi:hypothetical protein